MSELSQGRSISDVVQGRDEIWLSRISGTQAVRKERSGVIARYAWMRGRGA